MGVGAVILHWGGVHWFFASYCPQQHPRSITGTLSQAATHGTYTATLSPSITETVAYTTSNELFAGSTTASSFFSRTFSSRSGGATITAQHSFPTATTQKSKRGGSDPRPNGVVHPYGDKGPRLKEIQRGSNPGESIERGVSGTDKTRPRS